MEAPMDSFAAGHWHNSRFASKASMTIMARLVSCAGRDHGKTEESGGAECSRRQAPQPSSSGGATDDEDAAARTVVWKRNKERPGHHARYRERRAQRDSGGYDDGGDDVAYLDRDASKDIEAVDGHGPCGDISHPRDSGLLSSSASEPAATISGEILEDSAVLRAPDDIASGLHGSVDGGQLPLVDTSPECGDEALPRRKKIGKNKCAKPQEAFANPSVGASGLSAGVTAGDNGGGCDVAAEAVPAKTFTVLASNPVQWQ